MEITREHIKIAIFVVLAIAATIIITSIFKGSKKPDEKLYEQLMQAYQSQIDDLHGRLESEGELRDQQWKIYEDAMRNDSVLLSAFKSNQANYTPINKRLNEIPSYIKSLNRNRDSIRRAFSIFP